MGTSSSYERAFKPGAHPDMVEHIERTLENQQPP
jgi:hypothetical protein